MDNTITIIDAIRKAGLKRELVRAITIATVPMDESQQRWGILVNGKWVSFHNGKSQWRTKHIALIALSDKIKHHVSEAILKEYNFSLSQKETDALYKELIEQLEKEGIIEFRMIA